MKVQFQKQSIGLMDMNHGLHFCVCFLDSNSLGGAQSFNICSITVAEFSEDLIESQQEIVAKIAQQRNLRGGFKKIPEITESFVAA